MSVISSVVLSAEGQGPAIGSVDDLTGFMHVELPSLDPLKLLTLYTIVADVEFDEDMIELFPMVGGDEEEGPWVVEIPAVLRDALVALPADKLPEAASQWADTDELQDEGWSTDQAGLVIESLKKLASLSKTTAQQLYLRLDL